MGEPLPGSARSAGGAETLAGRLGCRALSSTGAAMTLIPQQPSVCRYVGERARVCAHVCALSCVKERERERETEGWTDGCWFLVKLPMSSSS